MITLSSFSGIVLLGGTVLFLAGLISRIFPPKKINWFYGFRTLKSMKSQEAWVAANQYSSRLSIYLGGILVTIGLFSLFVGPLTDGLMIYGVVMICASLILVVWLTGRKLKD
jgi:uncharacterized membrane protein